MHCTAACLTLLMSLSPLAMANEVYKWVDSRGVTHFDALPPDNRPSVAVPLPRLPPVPVSSSAPEPGSTGPDQATIDHQVRKAVSADNAKLRTFCTNTRTNLAQLQNNPRLSVEVNGQVTRLTEVQRQKMISEAQGQIASQCQ
jgi:hypothetical protein